MAVCILSWSRPRMAADLKSPPTSTTPFTLLQQGAAAVDDVTRALPHALGPEKSLLSSMLQDPQEYIGVAIEEKLTTEHFYLPSHSTLFGFLIELFEGGHEVELVSLVQRLLDRGLLDRVGGPAALTDLYTYAPSPGHFRHHLQHVKDKFVLRSIIQNSNEAIAQAYDAPDEVATLLDTVEPGFSPSVKARRPTRRSRSNNPSRRCSSNFKRCWQERRGRRGFPPDSMNWTG